MNNKSFQSFSQILEYIIKYFKGVMVFAAVLVILSGLYTVESNEVAVVLRFGRLVGNTPQEQIREPGLHFAFPFFIDEVIRVPIHTVHEREITTHYVSGRIPYSIADNGYLLTGDNNIVLIRATVRYQISEPTQYALFSSNAADMIDGIVSGELTRTVTTMHIDHVLTAGRAQLAAQILRNSQRTLDDMGIGVAITSVELTDIVPPVETRAYFEEVRSAAIRRETTIQQAREQAQSRTLNAEAIASSIIQTTISEQNHRLTIAHNEIAEFDGLYDQFTANPEIIISSVFRQRIAAIIANSGNTIIFPDGSETPIIVLP